MWLVEGIIVNVFVVFCRFDLEFKCKIWGSLLGWWWFIEDFCVGDRVGGNDVEFMSILWCYMVWLG